VPPKRSFLVGIDCVDTLASIDRYGARGDTATVVLRPFLFSDLSARDGSINNGSTKETTISIEISVTITIEMTIPSMILIELSMIENSMILMMDSPLVFLRSVYLLKRP
jgi:hypothetical protein